MLISCLAYPYTLEFEAVWNVGSLSSDEMVLYSREPQFQLGGVSTEGKLNEIDAERFPRKYLRRQCRKREFKFQVWSLLYFRRRTLMLGWKLCTSGSVSAWITAESNSGIWFICRIRFHSNLLGCLWACRFPAPVQVSKTRQSCKGVRLLRLSGPTIFSHCLRAVACYSLNICVGRVDSGYEKYQKMASIRSMK
jgi:hypothetical protein